MSPTITDSDLQTLVPELIQTAERAGSAVLEVYNRTDLDVTYKEDDSPLTQADLASQEVIAQSLQQLTPDIPILSEESKAAPFEVRKDWTTFWLVDPLDGTKEFVKRNGEFTVNIALVQGGTPRFGVVHAPVLGTTYWAASPLGAFKIKDGAREAIHVTPHTSEPTSEGPLKVVTSRSHAGEETEALLERLEAYAPIERLSIGSSLKLCLVAEGAAHLYPRFGPTMEWDTAAAQCVAEVAGATVGGLDGQRLRYNKENLLNPYFVVSADEALYRRTIEE